jgi:hypothetical protein
LIATSSRCFYSCQAPMAASMVTVIGKKRWSSCPFLRIQMRISKCWAFVAVSRSQDNASKHGHGILWCLLWCLNRGHASEVLIMRMCLLMMLLLGDWPIRTKRLVVVNLILTKAPSRKHQLAPTKTARETASATAGITKPHTDRAGTVALLREILPLYLKRFFLFSVLSVRLLREISSRTFASRDLLSPHSLLLACLSRKKYHDKWFASAVQYSIV